MRDGKAINVLLVEDDEDDHLLIRRLLAADGGARFALTWAATFDAGREALRAGGHDVALLDYRLGPGTGLDLLREATAAGARAPLILLTGRGDRDVDLEAMKAGAADYLPKDRLTADLLGRSVRYAVERHRADEALRQAQKMEAVGRLAGGIAHDFNNLLMVISGYGELLEGMLPDGHPGRGPLGEIRSAQERCAALTGQLLAFGRRQARRVAALDLSEVVGGMAGLLRPLLRPDIELAVDPAPGLGRVLADRVQVEQVVLNLAANARDAMPGGGRLSVATANADVGEAEARGRPGLRPGRYVLMTVRDTGCGMDGATLAHAFEPFFTTKGVGKGTGLGLATVYGVVKQSGGFVYADSAPGAGTAFHVYLPRHDGEAERPAGASPRRAAAGGAETVLLVDDEASVRGVVRLTLERLGYAVLEAADGAEALAVSGRHGGTVHLLVADVVMPRMGGGELAERLRAERPGLRVLFVSGYAEDAAAGRGVQAGRAGFLPKPFSLDALARKVRELLDGPAPMG